MGLGSRVGRSQNLSSTPEAVRGRRGAFSLALPGRHTVNAGEVQCAANYLTDTIKGVAYLYQHICGTGPISMQPGSVVAKFWVSLVHWGACPKPEGRQVQGRPWLPAQWHPRAVSDWMFLPPVWILSGSQVYLETIP
jgi:hypothetical protein